MSSDAVCNLRKRLETSGGNRTSASLKRHGLSPRMSRIVEAYKQLPVELDQVSKMREILRLVDFIQQQLKSIVDLLVTVEKRHRLWLEMFNQKNSVPLDQLQMMGEELENFRHDKFAYGRRGIAVLEDSDILARLTAKFDEHFDKLKNPNNVRYSYVRTAYHAVLAIVFRQLSVFKDHVEESPNEKRLRSIYSRLKNPVAEEPTSSCQVKEPLVFLISASTEVLKFAMKENIASSPSSSSSSSSSCEDGVIPDFETYVRTQKAEDDRKERQRTKRQLIKQRRWTRKHQHVLTVIKYDGHSSVMTTIPAAAATTNAVEPLGDEYADDDDDDENFDFCSDSDDEDGKLQKWREFEKLVEAACFEAFPADRYLVTTQYKSRNRRYRYDVMISERTPGGKHLIVDAKFYETYPISLSVIRSLERYQTYSRPAGLLLLYSEHSSLTREATERAKQSGIDLLRYSDHQQTVEALRTWARSKL